MDTPTMCTKDGSKLQVFMRPLSRNLSMVKFLSISSFSVTDDYIKATSTTTVLARKMLYNFAPHSWSLTECSYCRCRRRVPKNRIWTSHAQLLSRRRANANYVYSEETLLAKYSLAITGQKSCQQPLQSQGGPPLYADHPSRVAVRFWSTPVKKIHCIGASLTS